MLRNIFHMLPLIISGILFSWGCGNSSTTKISDKDSVSAKPLVSIYYLHQKKSCMTCKAVGNVSRTTAEENFSKEIKEGTLAFFDLDISDPANTALADKFECSWAGLYILSAENGQEVAVDLTDVGFMYAVNNPDTLKQIVKTTITEKLQDL